MKKLIIVFVGVLSILLPQVTLAANRSESLYVLKDNFVDSYTVLVERTSSLYKGEIWVVEYGIRCLSMWRYEDKSIIASYSTWLDGVGGKLILPNKSASGSCRIWGAKPVEDVVDDLREEDWDWLRDNGYLK